MNGSNSLVCFCMTGLRRWRRIGDPGLEELFPGELGGLAGVADEGGCIAGGDEDWPWSTGPRFGHGLMTSHDPVW
jgi:hypothetical protein